MSFSHKDLCGPDPNPMTLKEAEALQLLCAWLPENPAIIQIGAERGASTLAILEERGDAFVLSIDMGVQEREYENLKQAGLQWKRVVRGLGRSQNIGYAWPEHWTCDLLYIDGDHQRPGIDDDILLWADAVKVGGYLAFHDYIPPQERGAHIRGRVWEAVEEWRKCEAAKDFDEVLHVGRLVAFKRC